MVGCDCVGTDLYLPTTRSACVATVRIFPLMIHANGRVDSPSENRRVLHESVITVGARFNELLGFLICTAKRYIEGMNAKARSHVVFQVFRRSVGPQHTKIHVDAK